MTDGIREPDESWEESQQPIFDGYYHRVFDKRGLVTIDRFRDAERQVQGMDLALIFASGKRVTVDEKFRRPDKQYRDIAIELRHEYDDERPDGQGWIRYSHCTYVLYYWGWSGDIFWLPLKTLRLALQRLWDQHVQRWPGWCSLVRSRWNNLGYTTINIGIPAERLMALLDTEAQSSGGLRPRKDNIDIALQQVPLVEVEVTI